jgi:thiamine transport system substrate-binding protein
MSQSFLVTGRVFMFKKRSHQPKRNEEKEQRSKGFCHSSPLLHFSFSIFLCLCIFVVKDSVFAQTLRVLTHDSFAISEDVITAFTEETGIVLEFLPGGDAGEIVNRAILTKDNPLADVLYGVDNSLLAKAVAEDIFIPYQSPELANVEDGFEFDSTYSVTPIDVGYINFNLDKAYFEENNLALPTDITDLTAEAYKGLTVVQNPATSSPGLGFMLATIARFGEEGDYTWLDFWRELRDNEVLVASGWNDAYYTSFTRYGGDKPIVLSYASSPAAEVIFSDPKVDEAPTLNLFCEKCVYEQIEAVGILKGTQNEEAAKQFVDYMLSERFQTDIPGNMFVYPIVDGIALPAEFEQFSATPSAEQIATLAPDTIETNLQRWLKEWTAVVEQGQ